MDKEEIFKKVKASISENLGIDEDEIMMDSNISEDLGCDSLMMSELIMRLEDEFNLRISDPDAEKLTTIVRIVDYISENAN